jgi:hypothetical protein
MTMRRPINLLSAAEGLASERALLSNEVAPWQSAKGLVIGGALSGALWTVAGLLTWYLI